VTTIRDIARESGFSVSTVSRVLAGHRDVSESTAVAIQAVVDRYHFTVNRAARNLKQAETMTILVLVKGRHNLLFASMLEHVQAAVTATGYSVAAQYIDEDDNEVAEAERLIAETKPAGVVFLGADADHLVTDADRLGEGCPAVVLTNSVGTGRAAVSSVTTDDFGAARAAAAYLLDRGHRMLGVIGGNPAVSTISRLRAAGVQAAVAARGLTFDPATQYAQTRYSLGEGYDAAGWLLDAGPGVTAVYAMSDIMALGALRALADRGLGVPADVSLIGHDGIDLASYVVPKLVTLRQPQETLARRGVEILMTHIGGDPTPVEEIVGVDIVEGESVRTLP
jgi:LacI family transcriptional regulator